MSLLTSSPVSFTLSQLEHLAANYLLQSKNFGDHDREFANELLIDFLGYAKSADKVATGAPEANSHTLKTINTNTSIIGPQTGNSTSGFSSAGKILSKPTRATMIKSNKVVLVQNQKSAALSVLSSPEAILHIENYNKDLDIENEKVINMDNVVQIYSDAEDGMIETARGLLKGMKLKGAIPFSDFKKTFSTTKFQKGFYNTKEGDIYSKSNFTARGNHSQVAARLVNYNYNCRNPAFGVLKAQKDTTGDEYLEVPNDHSAIYYEEYDFPSPMSDREVIVNIVWKRVSEKSIIIA
ncbi:hypothetical protein TrST_g11454 [Triparma strigata]|uniref:Uncharacterized protein n=1 Tax=Triparma strigata TaxID=1606541 RepID=A0A9W7AA26_9STRA|nr:hypothetical protein TrST_g11454 [Triparma strigata]